MSYAQSSSLFRMGLVQIVVGSAKQANLQRAAAKVAEAAEAGAHLVALPECFNSPYGVKHFPKYAEEVPGGQSCQAMAKMAKENKVFLVGGSIPERDNSGKLFNTCTVWSPQGNLLAKYRKIHLFDIDVPGKITFKESDALSPGEQLATFEVPGGSDSSTPLKVGLGVCYDLRFSELGRIYAEKGCHLLIYPGAFNMTTGPAHWELLTRGRALDNQLYVASVSPAREEGADYVAWGHTTVADPWGQVALKMGHQEQVSVVILDVDRVEEVRGQVPVTSQRRKDLFDTVCKI